MDAAISSVFDELNLQVLQRDWLSSNNIVFSPAGQGGATVVDTGYWAHAGQTVALVQSVLGGAALERIVNTHLHSDHCGGNRALQERWPRAQTWVPESSLGIVQAWDEGRLSYRLTGQHCERFSAGHGLADGRAIELGGSPWQVHAVGGHDPDAVMLFEPQRRVLISGDALWRNKVAVIFPEFDGQDGFEAALATLDLIESLDPAVVIPGHGEPFVEVADALGISRARLLKLQAQPESHMRHALRVLMVFHLLEHRSRPAHSLCRWMADSPMASRPAVHRLLGLEPMALAQATLQSLLDDGVLRASGQQVCLA